jgi:hypothetical protein
LDKAIWHKVSKFGDCSPIPILDYTKQMSKLQIRWAVIVPYVMAAVAVAWALSHHQFSLSQRAITLLGMIPLGPLATIVVGYYAVYKAVDNYTKQKWWERRVEEYSRLVDALSTIRADIILRHLQYDHTVQYGEPSEQYNDRLLLVKSQVEEATEYVHGIGISGSFMLSSAAVDALARFGDFITACDREDFEATLKYTKEHCNNCIKIINECAILDLGIK